MSLKWKDSKSERLKCARMFLKPVRGFLRLRVSIQEQGLPSRRFCIGGGWGRACQRTENETDHCLQIPRGSLEASFPHHQPAPLKDLSFSHMSTWGASHSCGAPQDPGCAQQTETAPGLQPQDPERWEASRPLLLSLSLCDPTVLFWESSGSTANDLNIIFKSIQHLM